MISKVDMGLKKKFMSNKIQKLQVKDITLYFCFVSYYVHYVYMDELTVLYYNDQSDRKKWKRLKMVSVAIVNFFSTLCLQVSQSGCPPIYALNQGTFIEFKDKY